MAELSPIIILSIEELCNADKRLEFTEPEESVARLVDVEMAQMV